MTKHTPGPWKMFYGKICSPSCESLGFLSGEFTERSHDLANALRVIACVNACEGINPKAVPDLLKALKEAKDQLIALCSYDDVPVSIFRAIAKAEEE